MKRLIKKNVQFKGLYRDFEHILINYKEDVIRLTPDVEHVDRLGLLKQKIVEIYLDHDQALLVVQYLLKHVSWGVWDCDLRYDLKENTAISMLRSTSNYLVRNSDFSLLQSLWRPILKLQYRELVIAHRWLNKENSEGAKKSYFGLRDQVLINLKSYLRLLKKLKQAKEITKVEDIIVTISKGNYPQVLFNK